MIELTEQQRQELARGKPVSAQLSGKDVILLQEEIFRWIQGILTTLVHSGQPPAKP